ncbi:MAG: DUF2818 family protein [Neisseriaceae bacterium]|nr:DUF2818 family protein [Neisseriaceae bacterium]
MNTSIYILLTLAIILANLPFILPRLFGVIKINKKHFGFILLEWLVAYVVVGVVAYFLEKSITQPHHQGWTFYAVTLSLFATAAFPGFVYRYFWRKKNIVSSDKSRQGGEPQTV